jgi:hypothetical protein
MRVQRHFAWAVVADQTLELFRSALLHRRRAVHPMARVRV